MNNQINDKDLLNLINNNSEAANSEGMVDFLNNKSKKLPQQICMGKDNILTPKMIQKIIAVNKESFADYPQVEQSFRELKKASNNFYCSLVRLLQETQAKKISFEYGFDRNVQPLGQNFVNNLKALKYKIDEVRIDNPEFLIKLEKNQSLEVVFKKPIFKTLKKGILKVKKAIVYYPQTSYKAYIIMTMLGVILAGFGGFMLAGSVDSLERASFAASYASLAVLILFMASFTIQLFEYTDIEGRNVLAYNYKTLINSLVYKVHKKVHDEVI